MNRGNPGWRQMLLAAMLVLGTLSLAACKGNGQADAKDKTDKDKAADAVPVEVVKV